MIIHANERIEDLKSRGYANAGLYDPQGVGGTHVMYVLHHADQPEIYSDLPADPAISAVVEGWKGPAKTIGLAAIGLAAVGTILHGLLGRANKVSAEDEAHAEALIQLDALSRPDPVIRPQSEEL